MEATAEEVQVAKYPVYKDSGVEWLGEIPEHWEVKRLRRLAKVVNGATPSSGVMSYWDGEINWVTPAEINNVYYLKESIRKISEAGYRNCGTTLVPKGSIVLTTRAPIGKVAIADTELCTNQGCKALVVNGISSEYLFYQLFLRKEELNSLGKGTTFMELGNSDLKNLQIIYPSLNEQTAIAQFLDRKTAQIEKTICIKEKQIKLLKERRQVLINNAIIHGLDPDAPIKDSGVEWIGEIPSHWNLVSNKVLFQERKEPGNKELPLLMVSIHSAVSSEEISDEENIRGKIRIEAKSSYKLVKVGDIVFNMMRAWQGAIGAVRVEGMVSPAYIVAKPIASFNSDFFEFQYRTAAFIQQMDRASKGITDFRKRLYWDEFKQLLTILPPETEQAEIAEFILTLNSMTDKAILSKQKEIEKLKEYKASLINSAVTGKLKVC